MITMLSILLQIYCFTDKLLLVNWERETASVNLTILFLLEQYMQN